MYIPFPNGVPETPLKSHYLEKNASCRSAEVKNRKQRLIFKQFQDGIKLEMENICLTKNQQISPDGPFLRFNLLF
ncbi:hypothetical protein SAMN05444412_11917 [Rhodonellum ikkaensis]|uniref:Uncharacterized protein n=1 Tax=Rhodonellum ikkaensis TaxID=336829 RepID=A0A1H3TPI9_9BACT|nr:hypothetical protein SAMN05444412_11917 [Rhodonellum ikkaensis]